MQTFPVVLDVDPDFSVPVLGCLGKRHDVSAGVKPLTGRRPMMSSCSKMLVYNRYLVEDRFRIPKLV